MANLSFDITNSREFYNKLLEDYSDYKNKPDSSRLAINTAMTAWHLAEWLYSDHHDALSDRFPSSGEYLTHIKTVECSFLEIMRCITNGTKHCKTATSNSKVQSANKHIGPFSNVFARQFDQTYLFITMDDGTEHNFEDIMEIVMTFWGNYLTSEFTSSI